jgi:hypothetical protein
VLLAEVAMEALVVEAAEAEEDVAPQTPVLFFLVTPVIRVLPGDRLQFLGTRSNE